MADMTFDGTFSDLKLKVASESALQAIYPELVRLQDFCHTYSELEDRPGASIVIPTYDFELSTVAEFDADSNNYGSGVNEIEAANVTLDKHLVKSIAISDRDIAETGVQFVRDGAAGIASVLGRALNKYVFDMINETNIPLTATWDCTSKAKTTELYSVASDNGLDVGDSIVVLNPTEYAKFLQYVDYMQYGGTEAIRYGYIPGYAGFKSVVCSTNLGDGINGAIINRNTIGIASRYLAPLAGAYPQTWKATEPNSGFTIGFRLFADLKSGTRYLAGEALVGAGIFYGGKKAVILK